MRVDDSGDDLNAGDIGGGGKIDAEAGLDAVAPAERGGDALAEVDLIGEIIGQSVIVEIVAA